MATQLRVLIAVLAITLVAAEHASYAPRVRRRPMLSPQEGPDSSASESEQESIIHQGPPSDFSPSRQIPDEARSENEPEIGGLTVQDPPKGWPFSDMALQEKFKEQIQQEETAQRQMWASPPEQSSKQQRYRQGRLLESNTKGRKEQGSREEGSGEQTYREYPKKKRIVKPSHPQGMRIRQSNKQYQAENNQQEEQPQPQQYHPEQFEQQKIQQEQFGPEPILQEDVAPRPPKKTSKRRPNSSASTGGPSSVSVGYSLNFGNQDPGNSPRNPVGIVQNEVVHGEGAISYSNAQIGNTQIGNTQGIRNRPANANSIDGRPIYVAPIPSNYQIPQQNPAFNFPNQSPEHESLPNPAALVGEQQINGYAPEGVSVVKSTSHFEIGQNPDAPQIITQLDHSGQYETVKPTKPPTILHINDGTDFKWKNLGNGVEISAPVTPNGLKGGYRESIPIQEDNEEDIPVFEKKLPAFAPPIPPKPIVFNSGIPFEDPNVIFSGRPESLEGNFPQGEHLPTPQELISNHVFEEAPPKLASFQTGPSQFSRRPHAYNHNFAEPPSKSTEEVDLGFPKFPEMNRIYYLPNTKPGEAPIPAVAMPLSVLRQITGALDSQSTAHLGHDISTSDFMKMLAHNDAGPEPSPHFQEQRQTKQRNHGFNPNKGPRDHEAHGSSRPHRGHHRYQQSYSNNKHSSNLNVGPYGVKITKSIPIYEQHSVSTPNDASSHGPWNAPSKHVSQVQHFNIPLDAYESLRPSSGNFKGRPNHFREESFPSGSGRQQYRHARQNHQQNREMVPSEHSHMVDGGESFAVSSSYRIGPSAPSGWNKHGRN